MKHFSNVLILIAFLGSSLALSAQRTLRGTVTDSENGEALAGATVALKGTPRGTTTDAAGGFTLELPADAKTLTVSYVGYTAQDVALGESNVLTIALAPAGLIDEVVVVGSRSQTRTKLTTPVAVDVIPLTAVANDVGQVDLNQILTYVAPSFQSARQAISDGTDHVDPAQLRGLGPDQVLVLVNGKRRHQSALVNVNGTVNRGTVGTDLAAIPASAIERIEILRDGAAAQYGSDAIAGVINIVLKKKTDRIDASLSVGQNMTEYERNYALVKANKATDANASATDGQTIQVGLNYGNQLGKRGFYNLTGEFISRGETNRTGTYTGQIYPRNGANQIVDDSILAAKGLDRESFDMRIGQSRVRGGGVLYNLEYGLRGGWDIYSFGGFNRKRGNAAGFYRYPNAIVTAARTYADEALAIYPDGFLPEINSTVQDLSAALGVRGKWGAWRVDLSNTFGHNQFDFDITNSVNYTQASVAPTNLQREFDAGGLRFLQNTSNLDFARGFDVLKGMNLGLGAEFRVDGFGIRAGEEASWRNYDSASGAAAGAQVFSGFLPANEGNNTRNCVGLYADLEQDVTESLLLGAAIRFENYSDFGETFNWKAVARYKIGDVLTLRGSASTGFRAPSMQQRFYAKTNTLFVSQGGSLVAVESGTFPNGSAPANILGIPELKQETSTNYAAGLTVRPFAGLELTVDAYQIDIDDRIVLTNNFTDGGDSLLKVQLAAANAGQANFFTNAVDTRARGLEGVLSYSTKFGKNDLRLTVAGTFIKNEVKKDAEGNPIIYASETLERTGQIARYFNREDQSRIEVANPQSKVSAMLNYKIGKFGLMLRAVRFGEVVYLDPTIDPTRPDNFPANAFNDGAKETLDQTFSPKTVVDASLSYGLFKGLTLTVGANNLFDTYQDRHDHSGNMSLGRFVYSRRVQQFGFNGRYVFARLKFDLDCK
jgi:iron complex outermembrane recepter protein